MGFGLISSTIRLFDSVLFSQLLAFPTSHPPSLYFFKFYSYMDNFKVFTMNSTTYPAAPFSSFIKHLRDTNRHLITIIDPGIKTEADYVPYESGLARQLFIGLPKPEYSPYVGIVWPGKCAFPDWFNPETKKWWAAMVKEWVERTGAEGLWVDMNEISTFGNGNCAELGEAETAALMPVLKIFGQPEVEGDSIVMVTTTREERSTKEGIETSETLTVDIAVVEEEEPEPEPVPPFSVNNPPYQINNGGKRKPLQTKTSSMDAVHFGKMIEYNVTYLSPNLS